MDDSTADRIRDLIADDVRSAAEITRILRSGSDGHPPIGVRYEPVRRAVAQIRDRLPADAVDRSPAGMARRIGSLLDRELQRIEKTKGPADLDRLDRIAKTLRTLEPIRPKVGKEKASSLRSLLPEGEGQAEPKAQMDRIEDPGVAEAPASLAAFGSQLR